MAIISCAWGGMLIKQITELSFCFGSVKKHSGKGRTEATTQVEIIIAQMVTCGMVTCLAGLLAYIKQDLATIAMVKLFTDMQACVNQSAVLHINQPTVKVDDE